MLRAQIRTLLLVPLAVVLLLLPACGDDADDATQVGTSPSPRAAAGLPLEGTAWQLTALPDGSPVADTVAASATFDDGTVSGSGGCNSFSASYRLDGDTLTIEPVAATLMACEDPAMSTESAFLLALEQVAGYRTTADTLTLVDGDGGELLVLTVAQPVALAGATWQATSIASGEDAVSSPVAGTSVTAEFDADGRVSGSSGCNTYSGPYQADGDAITIGPLAGTRKACPEPAGVEEQEAAFLSAMQEATTYTTAGSGAGATLQLRDDDGALQVAFQAAG